MKRTSVRGEAVFTGLTGPHWFVPWHVRTSTGIGGRSYTGKIQIEVVALGQGVNYDYVVDPSGMGTHTTLQAAITAAVSSGARAIWVCTSAGTLREDIVIPDTAGETNDGAMFLIHTAPWSSIVQIEDPGELAPGPPRVRLQPSTDDTPAIVAYEPVQFQGFRIDNQSPTNKDAQLIVFKGANVIAEFVDCEIVQYDADKPVFSTTWDGSSSCDVVKLENCIVRHDSGYYIMSTGFNLAGGLLMRRVSAYGVWNSVHAFRLIVDMSGFKANDADHPVFDCDGGYEEVRLTNCRIENAGNGGTFTCATGYANADLHFSNTHFKGSGAGRGLLLAWCHKVTVSGCTFEDFATGVDIIGSVSAGIKLYGIAISDNVFDTCTTGINDGGNLDADELATIVTYPNAYYNCTTDSDFWLGPDAGDSSYTPNQGNDWPGDDPDDVAEALDDLADRLQDVTEVDFFVGTATGELSNEIVLSYARGSILYGAASAWDVLAKGTDGYFLKAGADDIAWAAITEADISDLGSYVTAHAILDGSAHSDSVAAGVTRGSLIIGNATPAWDELVIGDAGSALGTDGTDISWSTSLALAGTLTVDTINEYTGAAGVTIEGVELKDSIATIPVRALIGGASVAPAVPLRIAATSDHIILDETDAGEDNRLWLIDASGGDFRIVVGNDAWNAWGTALTIQRTGTTVDSISLLAPLKVDVIGEYTGGVGVTADGVLLKDTEITLAKDGNIDLALGATDANTVFMIDYPNISSADALFRLFRQTNTSGSADFQIFKADGTATLAFQINADEQKTRCYGELEIDGALNHDGSTVGFFGTTPASQVAAYTPSNVSADRAFDANATTIDELADVLGTLIADLQTYGLLQ